MCIVVLNLVSEQLLGIFDELFSIELEISSGYGI